VPDADLRDRARAALLDVLEDNDLDVSEVGEDRWITMLGGSGSGPSRSCSTSTSARSR
jgi:hypothetical protein